VNEFTGENGINHVIAKLKETRSMESKKGSDGQRLCALGRTLVMLRRQYVHRRINKLPKNDDDDDNHGTHQSQRQIARDLNVSHMPLQNMTQIIGLKTTLYSMLSFQG
jgi:hypothetical protein